MPPVEVGTFSSTSNPKRVVYLEELIFSDGVRSQWINEAAGFRSAFLIGSSVLTELQELKLGAEIQSPSGVAMSTYTLNDQNGDWPSSFRAFSFRDMRNLNTHTMCGLPFRITREDGTFQPGYKLFLVCKT